ncbi:ABC transporter permease [Ferruginibacter paludis]|uniref:ABC transporter permease n=1 Tax=Ferruginibacter paludis TaxID=1310417 RepID=UPI0025B45DCB|nr:ABC transporter permease [Ferruginibacter paludis]MDN3655932.1 ABC transporter permease [Ferruginibacter paludis]
MIKNYFKIAWRNLWRNKAFSAINILGLAIGIATCLIIMLFVNNELSFDRYNTKADRIFAVSFQGNIQGEKMNEGTVMPPVAQTLKADYPEVEASTRLRNFGTPKITVGNKSFKEDAFAFVDANFFQVFTLPLIAGDEATALREPNTVVLTKAMAHKYFGDEDPIGKVITLNGDKNTVLKVTGMINEVPVNSNFHFEIFASMSGLAEAGVDDWMRSNFHTYLLLAKNYDYKKLEVKLPQVVDKYIGPQMLKAMGTSLTDFRKKGNDISFHLKPITAIHLDPDYPNEMSPAGDVRNVYIFGAIAVFMLLIACINFMNLSTAGASKRAREVGIRKVLGSLKSELVKQFLFESIIISAIALLLAITCIYTALPVFNKLTGQSLSLRFADHPFLLPGLVLFVLFTGVLAGSYPAFYLSSFKPIAVLKGKFINGKKGLGLRGSLVVFQFFISIILAVGTTVVFKQLYFLQHKDIGYNKDQVLIIPNVWTLGKNQETFYQQLVNDSRVASVSGSGYLPAGPSDNNNFFVSPEQNPGQMIKTLRYDVDENYIATLGIHLQAGRNFSKDFSTDSSAVILNETAAKVMGWEKGAVGQNILYSNNKGEKINYHVIGVVKDFNFKSLHERISPLVMSYAPNRGTLIAKLKTTDVAGLTNMLAKRWTELGSEDPLSYSFLDDRFNNTYKGEQKIGTILGIFAGLTILVACLGLFGLAMFTAQQRTKEIGVRKVLGASVLEVTNMLSKEFLKLVLIACIIAFPLAWWAMHKWLQDFAYQTTISWWVFAGAGVAASLIALSTVSFQAVKAALVNPVKSLKAE